MNIRFFEYPCLVKDTSTSSILLMTSDKSGFVLKSKTYLIGETLDISLLSGLEYYEKPVVLSPDSGYYGLFKRVGTSFCYLFRGSKFEYGFYVSGNNTGQVEERVDEIIGPRFDKEYLLEPADRAIIIEN